MDLRKTRVLFICNHNSARSQMAEAFLNSMGGDRFEAESAGVDVRELNPLAVATALKLSAARYSRATPSGSTAVFLIRRHSPTVIQKNWKRPAKSETRSKFGWSNG